MRINSEYILRDLYAAIYLAQNPPRGENSAKTQTRKAYRIADGIINERRKILGSIGKGVDDFVL